MNNNTAYTLSEHSGVKYISFPAFDRTGLIKCVFSTRIGGVSKAPYESLNLGFTTNDKIKNVKENRARFSEIIKDAFKNKILQIHGNNIIKIEKKIEKDTILGAADAMMTNLSDTPLAILVADCLVVFILDPVKKSVAAMHCGWRGTVQNIIGEALKKMSAEYGTDSKDCLAAISPGIGGCCFLVDKDVYDAFNSAYPEWADLINKVVGAHCNVPLQKWSIDLNQINYRLLLKAGIKKEHISSCKLCTSCEKELFYSYRRDNKDTGRMAGVISIL